MVKLAQEHGDNVQAITLNLDYDGSGDAKAPTDESLAKVQRVLTKFNIDAQNLVCTTECDTVLEKLGSSLGLPTVIVYDKQGEKAKLFEGMFSYEDDVNPLVTDLVAAEK